MEGYRTDVRVVNLSYLTTDWYVNQLKHPTYDAAAIDMLASPKDYAHDRLQFAYFINPDSTKVNALSALKETYGSNSNNTYGLMEVKHPNMYIPIDKEAAIKAGRVNAGDSLAIEDYIDLNMLDDSEGGLRLSKLIAIDMLATNAENGFKRPIYFAMTIPDDYYMGLSPYMQSTGMAYEVGPIKNPNAVNGQIAVNTDKAYDNIVNKFRWGGLDKAKSADDIYLDETVRRMVTTTRSTMLDLATALYNEGVTMEDFYVSDSVNMDEQQRILYKERIADRFKKAKHMVDLMVEKLPEHTSPYGCLVGWKGI